MSSPRDGSEAGRIPCPGVRLGYEARRDTGCDPPNRARRALRRGPWENAAAAVIGVGIVMQMQPFALDLYTWSFAVIIAGTAGFIVASHLPE
jgi:hypothetical protein